jgi:uncharacterized protein (TIGR01777 family)
VRVLVTGSTGLVGTALVRVLRQAGYTVVSLRRPQSRHREPGDALWDPAAGHIDAAALEDLDAVVHLAGENIAAGRWNAERKARIRDSRVLGTRLLAEALAARRRPPRVLVCSSAMGFYGDRGDEILDENSPPGDGFLSETCIEWEAAAAAAVQAGIRTVHLRSGIVLDAADGPLARMLVPFRWGLGGRLGSGRQFMSWVTLDDTIAIIRLAMDNEDLRGPVNSVAPSPVTNAEFTRILGRALGRPAFLPVPAWAVRLLFGEMADALLLSSTRVVPGVLQRAGFAFRHADLEAALRDLLS